MRIRTQLTLGFIFVGALVALASILAIRALGATLSRVEAVHSETLFASQDLDSLMSSAVQESFAYVASGDPAEVHQFWEKSAAFEKGAASFRVLANLDDESETIEAGELDTIEAAHAALKREAAQLFSEFQTGRGMQTETFLRYERVVDDFAVSMAALSRHEKADLDEAHRAATSAVRSAEYFLCLVGVGALVLSTLLGLALGRRLTRPLLALRDSAIAFGHGARGAPFEVRSRGEIGDLERAFRTMGVDIERLLGTIESQKKQISDISGELVLVLHRDGRIAAANAQARSALGFEEAALLLRPFRELVEDGPALDQLVATALAQGTVATLDGSALLTRSGERLPVHLAVSPLTSGATSEASGFVCVAQDLRERKALEARLDHSEKLSTIGQLAAGVAHEINNPLAYVTANLTFAVEELNGRLAEAPEGGLREIVEALEEASEGAARTAQIVRDLKLFARSDDSEGGLLDVRQVLETALKMTAPEVRQRARVTKDLGPVPLVLCNEGRLAQVFLNLLVNAAQAIPEGRAGENTVSVRTLTDRKGGAVIEIRDTGAGIPPDVRARIFEPFFTTKPVGTGTGLGLSICHGIIARAGGTIEVESVVGEGTVFRVVLPPGTSAGRAASVVPLPSRAVTRRGRVLVVDDEPLVGKAVKRMLAPEHDVECVTSGKQALARILGGQPYDVVLCDLLMPDASGMQLHEDLVARSPSHAARMVFITGGAFTPASIAFLEAVDNPRLEKPVDPTRLRGLVREWVAQRDKRPVIRLHTPFVSRITA